MTKNKMKVQWIEDGSRPGLSYGSTNKNIINWLVLTGSAMLYESAHVFHTSVKRFQTEPMRGTR